MILFFGQLIERLWIDNTWRLFLSDIGLFPELKGCLFCTFRDYAVKILFLDPAAQATHRFLR